MTIGARVEIIWEDAYFDNSNYHSAAGDFEIEPALEHSLGYWIRGDKTHVVIAMSKHDKPEKEYRDLMVIPRGMVRRISRLK